MEMKEEIKILAIESSCDETAAAVVVNGREVRSNIISSQIDLHTVYGRHINYRATVSVSHIKILVHRVNDDNLIITGKKYITHL